MEGTCPRCGYSSGNDYVDDFTTVTGNHIVAGGRIVGKTEMIVQRAVEDAKYGKSVLVVVPMQAMAQQIRDRVRDEITEGVVSSISGTIGVLCGGGDINFVSAMHDLEGEHVSNYDTLLVDEATELQQSDVMAIDARKSRVETVGLFFTPTPEESLLNGFAQYNTSYETWHIPQPFADHISEEKMLQLRERLQYRLFQTEVEAKYWNGDEPIASPDWEYSSS